MRVFFCVGLIACSLGMVSAANTQTLMELFAPPPPAGPPAPDEQEKLQEMLKDKKKRAAYIESCINMMLNLVPAACEKNLPVLDKSSCKDMFVKRKADARKTCEAMARGESVQLNMR